MEDKEDFNKILKIAADLIRDGLCYGEKIDIFIQALKDNNLDSFITVDKTLSWDELTDIDDERALSNQKIS